MQNNQFIELDDSRNADRRAYIMALVTLLCHNGLLAKASCEQGGGYHFTTRTEEIDEIAFLAAVDQIQSLTVGVAKDLYGRVNENTRQRASSRSTLSPG